MTRRALLLSGGMDSSALAWSLRPDVAITVDYGQLAARGELRASCSICSALGIRHRTISIDCRSLGSGDMAGTDPSPLAPVSEWWPFRNQLLITMAASVAIQEQTTAICLGAVSTDESHLDGRPAFYEAMQTVLAKQEGDLTLEVPAIHESTSSLCRRVDVPFEILAWSHSCHVSDFACGRCRGCNKHREAMRELGHDEY